MDIVRFVKRKVESDDLEAVLREFQHVTGGSLKSLSIRFVILESFVPYGILMRSFITDSRRRH